jgi:hypothetical protein
MQHVLIFFCHHPLLCAALITYGFQNGNIKPENSGFSFFSSGHELTCNEIVDSQLGSTGLLIILDAWFQGSFV